MYGYAQEGDNMTVCQADASWSSTGPECIAITCDIPLYSGHLTLSSTNNKVDDVIMFTCYYGFQLVGSNQSQCELGGSWSHPFPSCTGMFSTNKPLSDKKTRHYGTFSRVSIIIKHGKCFIKEINKQLNAF